MAPRPPARDTAAVIAGDDAEPMPPSAIGCSMSNKSQIGVRIMQSSLRGFDCPLARDLRPARPEHKAAIRRRAGGTLGSGLQAGDKPGVKRIVRREHVIDRS